MTGHNHRPNCGCGWCIGGWRGFGERGPRSARPFSDSFTIPNARCPVCKASVFFYQSPHGGRVFFDDLGPPWPKHPCTDNSDRVYQPVRVNDARRSEAKRVNPQWKQDGWVPIRIAEIISGTKWMMIKFLFLDDKFYSFRALQARSDIRVGTPALVKDLNRYGVGRIAWLSDANDALTTAEARMFHRAFTSAEPEALDGAVSGNAADTLAVGIALSFGWETENSDGSFSYPPYLNWAIADAWLARAKALGALEADEWLRACRKMYSPKKLAREPRGGRSRRRRT